MPKVFTKTIQVSPHDIDELQHVNNVRYLQWVQDMAKAHWELLAPQSTRERYIWVVANHFIEYKGEAKAEDTLTLNTFVEASKGVTSIRIVEIYKEEKLITKAKTTWCLLDVHTKRPIRIPESIDLLFQ